MIEIPFKNYFYSHFIPENKNELIEHCLNAKTTNENFEWGDACISEKEMLELDGFIDVLKPSITRFLNEMTPLAIRARVDEVWINRYRKGYFQEIHHHQYADISFNIFLSDDAESNENFYFYNEMTRVMNEKFRDIFRAEEPGYLYMEDIWHLPRPEKGSIVFFPSYMLHGVSVQKTDEIRTTVSGNMVIDKV